MRNLVSRGLMVMAFAIMGLVGSAATVQISGSQVSIEPNTTSAIYMAPETCTERFLFGCPKP